MNSPAHTMRAVPTDNVASAMATAPPPRRPPPGPVDSRFNEPTPFARLAITHAASICGDVCLTVSLAGSLFFSVSPGQSREKVLLYLIITMAPFAVIAPLLSPLLDRIRGGRRLMIFLTCAARAVLCLFIARYVNADDAEALLIYPLAFGLLVAQKTYSIARSALVPAVVSGEQELVSANSRLAIISVIGGAVGGLPAVGIYRFFGAEGSLILAALVYALGSLLSWQIPRVETEHGGPDMPLEKEELPTRRSIILAGSAMGLLRGAVGFLRSSSRSGCATTTRRRGCSGSCSWSAASASSSGTSSRHSCARSRGGGHPRRRSRPARGRLPVRGPLGIDHHDHVRRAR